MIAWIQKLATQYRSRQRVPFLGGRLGRTPFLSPVVPVPLELLRYQTLVEEELLRLREMFLRAYVEPRFPQAPTVPLEGGDVPTATSPDDTLEDLLMKAQLLVLHHPVAAQAAYAALVAEGRRFAESTEGAKWRDTLMDSPLVQRARTLWEKTTLSLLEEVPVGLLPSTLIDILVAASAPRGGASGSGPGVTRP
ncbi:hypothetical protein LZ198_17780 [Myxococcus sp. K15C18031901]|uniref:hypothetical protein n=1 Tax=Myxococcus dinghuensis TaxID=2906761 RepID=UPI0020A7EA50|nr:hypothetical protein [Myxococcus dinghuensis]MCP3100723.1 hypothetical protein [Myxococcus dinghuensis]